MDRKDTALQETKTSLSNDKNTVVSTEKKSGVRDDKETVTEQIQSSIVCSDSDMSSNETKSENADRPWLKRVEKLNADTALALEKLKDTCWREEDGTVRECVLQNLGVLYSLHFRLSKQNAPQVYVDQSLTDIAKAMLEAHIIPSICNLLMYLYGQSLELSESHDYDYIMHKVLMILIYYADEAENIDEIANCPNFLEFIGDVLEGSSAKYLNSATQDEQLGCLLEEIITLVSTILENKTNVSCLRILKFEDSLKPYLKAHDNDIQRLSLATLMKIIIDESFAFNDSELQSKDVNWQTIVKKVTELIEREVKDLRDTEWVREDGTYKISVNNCLRLIAYVYFEVRNHDTPLQYIQQSRKNIAREMIDANIIPKLCGILTDNHQQKPVGSDIYGNAKTILWSYTDASADFAEEVAEVPGFLEFIIENLSLAKEEHQQLHNQASSNDMDKFLSCCLGIIHNISMSEACRTRLRNIKTIEVLRPYLQSQNSFIQISALASLAGITDEKESDIITSNKESVQRLMDVLRQGLKTVERRGALGQSDWSCTEIALTIRTLARNDANKKLLVECGALELLVELTEGEGDEQTEAVGALWALSFDEENRKIMVNNERLELVPALDRMKASENKKIREAAYGTSWNLRDLSKNPKLDRFRNIGEVAITAEGKTVVSLSDGASEMKRKGHIMISYQWSHQKTLLMIKEELVRNGFTVWMDVEDMSGDIYGAMAEAVENADIVLICLSHKYKISNACRQEAEYANLLNKKIVPLKLEDGYKPDGWLGLIAGSLLYYDFSEHQPNVRNELNRLILELRKKKEEIHPSPKENTIQMTTHDFVDGPRSHGSQGSLAVQYIGGTPIYNIVRQWKEDDVQSWMNKNNLTTETFGKLTGDEIALLLRMKTEAPDSFYKCVQKTWNCGLFMMSKLVWALDSIDQ